MCPDLKFSISYTTRALRAAASRTAGNIILCPKSEFEEMVRKDEFLEHADVFGNYYGTARRFLREAEQEASKICCWTSMCRARRRSSANSRML